MGLDLGFDMKRRFIIVPYELEFSKDMVILCDIYYWNTHYEELKDWCDTQLGTTQVGMTVEFDSEKDLMMFILRWS